MNTGLQQKQKMILKNIFLSWWIMQFFKKTMENVRKKCEFWYDYVKPIYGEKSKLCYERDCLEGKLKLLEQNSESNLSDNPEYC